MSPLSQQSCHYIKYLGRAPRQVYLQLVSSIDLDSVQLKQSMGALLNYLQNNIFNMDDGKRMMSRGNSDFPIEIYP